MNRTWNRRRRIAAAAVLVAGLLVIAGMAVSVPRPNEQWWTQRSFLDFSEGTLADAGANTYIAANGSIQLINRWDLNGDGHLDLVFPSSHDTGYGINSYVYWGRDRFDRS